MRASASTDTICAIATPSGAGGIGVVRVSGPRACEILAALWRGRTHPSQFVARTLYLGEIMISTRGVIASPQGEAISSRQGFSGDCFGADAPRNDTKGFHDKAMAVFMPAPRTYTGDDMVEISCHGSQIILARILEACVAAGARPAAPGEFTRRAFLAGKLDLAQAEAVADLICSSSERGARLASEQLDGRLSSEVRAAGSRLADIRAAVEASIDFPEEGIEQSCGDIAQRLGDIAGGLKKLSATYASGRMMREGVRVAIAGRPNSGKSSILNRIAGRDRALVHHEPGTTRDVIEESVAIGGVEFKLRDTAGVREAGCEVESLGIARTREEVAQADLVLAVFDGSLSPNADDEAVVGLIAEKRSIAVVNKCDKSMCSDMHAFVSNQSPIFVSALTGAGLDDLTARLTSSAFDGDGVSIGSETAVVASLRHKVELDNSIEALNSAAVALSCGEPIECVAHHLSAAQEALGSITGEVTTDELLDRIFSRFCIGK